ncbi:MAG: hypothetical protein D6820_09225 [Lentisphaerae bacterium]|nr:MAG: hypothetical protein D6820_09225 [Lentisphaerota bacterium]
MIAPDWFTFVLMVMMWALVLVSLVCSLKGSFTERVLVMYAGVPEEKLLYRLFRYLYNLEENDDVENSLNDPNFGFFLKPFLQQATLGIGIYLFEMLLGLFVFLTTFNNWMVLIIIKNVLWIWVSLRIYHVVSARLRNVQEKDFAISLIFPHWIFRCERIFYLVSAGLWAAALLSISNFIPRFFLFPRPH